MVLVCPDCGCDFCLVKAWVDINTNEFNSDIECNAYCPECEKEVDCIPEEEFEDEDLEETD